MPSAKKTRVFKDAPRTVSLNSKAARHPLNVRPLGNAILAGRSTHQSQLGDFAVFPEELLMEMFTYADAESLRALSHTSRVLYAYLYDEDLWKQLCIKSNTQVKWRGSWRCSVLKITEEALIQLPDNVLCSDLLYRPFQCSQIDYSEVFKNVIREEAVYSEYSQKGLDFEEPRGRIPRLRQENLTIDEYNKQWSSKPFILTSSPGTWPLWDLKTLLQRFPDVNFRQEAVQWPLKLYAEYLENNRDESPLYLFDCSSEAMNTLKKEYSVPPVFQQDYFTLLGECRPDHAWLIVGCKRSGSTFHKDPNGTCAWNAALTGRKLWIMFPPDKLPPGTSTDDDEMEVTSPVGLAEWVLSGFYNDAARSPDAQIGVTVPGECMYVPSGWWHAVINIDDCVALTQNFVPKSQLGKVLHFLKNKREGLSGFRPAQVAKVLRGETDPAIVEYLEKYDKLHLDEKLKEEDCGEMELPPMPIFELFRARLGEDAGSALAAMAKIEGAEAAKSTGRSTMWTALTESTGFSFGFTDSD